MLYINFTMTFGKNFWLEAFRTGKKAANSSKKSLTTAMSAIWTANTVRTIFRLRWNSGRCLFPLHFAAARQNCTAQNACGMISGSILGTATIFKSSLTHRKKHYCVPPNLPQRIANQLEHSCAYGEAYWQAVSDVARTLLKELRQQSAGHSPC